MSAETRAAQYLRQQRAQRRRLAREGLYDPQQESAACGVGMVAAIDGTPSRNVVLTAIEALKNLWHRGAVDADGKTGDGAGLHVALPTRFFEQHISEKGKTPGQGQLCVGMVFLPRTELAKQERTRQIIEAEILNAGFSIYGWRQVPVDIEAIGPKANATRPEIEQVMFEDSRHRDLDALERTLFITRRRIENQCSAESLLDAYICSLSARSIIYKGLFLAEQLSRFYPDLLDERFVSNFAIYHQRYSTNTFPSWTLAQPFRILAHNGEINTLSGNINWMKSHELMIADPHLDEAIEDIRPVIQPNSSDSSALDATFELLLHAGRYLPETKSLLIPEAWEHARHLSSRLRNFYRYAHGIMEPWDGPASLCAYDGHWVLAGLDRNGLRPLRYTITNNDLLIVGSESGIVRIPEHTIVRKGRIGPGGMVAVHLDSGQFYDDAALKEYVATRHDYDAWNTTILSLKDLKGPKPRKPSSQQTKGDVLFQQHLAGWTFEEQELILRLMICEGVEATGSMGDDSPLAVLSHHYRGLHHFFRQNFSQVTNPPMDSLRERIVMSLETRLGNLQSNILETTPEALQFIALDSPLLFSHEVQAITATFGQQSHAIDCSFQSHQSLDACLQDLQNEAARLAAGGVTHFILHDRNISAERIPMPMILATAAVHTHLVQRGLRNFCSINVQTNQVFDVHAIAILLGVGATTVNPTLVEATIHDRHQRNLTDGLSVQACFTNYRQAVNNGLLKIMSKMGISVISSYRGGYNFEAIGLSRALTNRYFPGMPSRLSGLGIDELQRRLCAHHKACFQGNTSSPSLPIGGFYRARSNRETHGWDGEAIHLLQKAVKAENYDLYCRYSEAVDNLPPVALRDLMAFVQTQPVAVDTVEHIASIRRRLVAPGISLGALSPIAHETLSIAMNRIGARSNSGEGGEDPERMHPRPNGDNARSAIKQIASGRFGVTAAYLNHCDEIEIKIAQGAKPGEGGQLPGYKISDLIARLRHSVQGVTLISPPPHHDIYSIEDLAQLIYDLKQINPTARVCVKLVSRAGVGTVAAGVAKAKADIIAISGHSGGTGASPQTSIKHAGLPWEMGLAEAHQVLTLNGLRHRVRLRTDGGLKTGRDIIIAALLGAEEYGIGTASLIAMGCLMVRQCHSNTCPVGICTQDQDLIKHFAGTPEHVITLFTFIAREVRTMLARLGFQSLDEIIGRTDLLCQIHQSPAGSDYIDLNPLLARVDSAGLPNRCTLEEGQRNEVPHSLDAQILEDCAHMFQRKSKLLLDYDVRNTHRAVGTRVSSEITRTFGMQGLESGHLQIRLSGSAGQSLGAFAVQGLRLIVEGDANDYVGKGLSGGEIIVKPSQESSLVSHENVIIGNTCLYGATGGRLYAAGLAGERFAVRNSGAVAVIEGCGANGCEYMTGGVVAVLGPVRFNFGAGMTGGQAFVYTRADVLQHLVNPQTIGLYPLEEDAAERLYQLISEHVAHTGSPWGQTLLENWHAHTAQFTHIIPHEMRARLLKTPPKKASKSRALAEEQRPA